MATLPVMNDSNPSDERGLTLAEVAERVASGHVNRPPTNDWWPILDILRRNVLTLFNALVVPAAIALFVLGDYRGAWAVSAMAVANLAIGLTHEFRAKRHLDQLSLMGETRVRVRRDGYENSIPSGEVVRDDLVLLTAGDVVVADGPVIRSEYLELDEALLTGESDPVPRNAGDTVQSGSVCVAGVGSYRAERVGVEAFAVRTAASARKYQYVPGQTQQTLDWLVKILTATAVALCLGYVALSYGREISNTELVQMVAATITSMVPQGLVLMTTLVLVLSAVRLSGRGAVVQRLSAVEGLAAVDVLCTDKTGTLTTGRQILDRIVPFHEPKEHVKVWLSFVAASSVDQRNKSIEALRALTVDQPAQAEILDQLPFQSQNRCSAILCRAGGELKLFVLGSVEKLAKQFSESDRECVTRDWHALLPTGLRLLAFAEGLPQAESLNGRLPDIPLRPLALIALNDELRPDVQSILAQFAAQGIRVKIVSGDHPETVHSLASKLGDSFATETVTTGDQWSADSDRSSLAERCDVFGRVSPEQKLALVETLQNNGHSVGMIGDGVNDILPIKKAHFGVAMGAGSPATKRVAGVVLESNEFASLPVVLGEGRRVVQNVRRAAKLFLLKNVYTVVLILVAVGVMGLPFPYLPQQVTLLNALTIGGPAILILANRRGSSPAIRTRFFADVGRFVLTAGLSTSVMGLAVYLDSSPRNHTDPEFARTMLLTTLILAGLGHAVIATWGQRWIFAWCILAIAIYLAVLSIPPVTYFFALTPLSIPQGLLTVAAAMLAVLPTAWVSRGDVRASENPPRAVNDPTPGVPAASGRSAPRE
jgi:cation-transporting ATPase E